MWGHVSSECLDIRVGIGDETDEEWAGVRMTTEDADTCGGKVRDARTRLVVLERGEYRSKPATKVLLSPITGRRHQLRVHCHYIGHTIVGDFTYSNRQDVLSPRMFLHAHRLVYRYLNSNCTLIFESSNNFQF